MSKIQVDTIDTRSGTSTMQIGSTNTSTITLGVSGDTINVPSGVTIANAGTATGFAANSPSFYAISNGDVSCANDTDVQLTFGNEIWDTDSAFASNTFTTPSGGAGKYFFISQVKLSDLDDGKQCQLMIRYNGSGQDYSKIRYYSSGSNQDWTALVTMTKVMAEGDTAKVYLYHNNGTTLTSNSGYNTFLGYRLIGV